MRGNEITCVNVISPKVSCDDSSDDKEMKKRDYEIKFSSFVYEKKRRKTFATRSLPFPSQPLRCWTHTPLMSAR